MILNELEYICIIFYLKPKEFGIKSTIKDYFNFFSPHKGQKTNFTISDVVQSLYNSDENAGEFLRPFQFSVIKRPIYVGLNKKYNPAKEGGYSQKKIVRTPELGVIMIYQYSGHSIGLEDIAINLKKYFDSESFQSHDISSHSEKFLILSAKRDVDNPQYFIFSFKFKTEFISKDDVTNEFRRALVCDPSEKKGSPKIRMQADKFYHSIIGEERTNIFMPFEFALIKDIVEYEEMDRMPATGAIVLYHYLGLPSLIGELKTKFKDFFKEICSKEKGTFSHGSDPDIIVLQDI